MSSLHLSEIDNLFYTEESWALLYKLSSDMMNYFWDRIEDGVKTAIDHKKNLAGNISNSYILTDPKNKIVNNIFYPVVLGKHQQKILKLRNDVNKENLKLELTGFWVNKQKKYEFNPLHSHDGDLSFVIWMQVPYSWDNEVNQPLVKESNTHNAVGNFMFVYPQNGRVSASHITMSPNVVGQIAIFPSYLQHLVYPFYTSDDERISVSGNIHLKI